MVDLNWFALYEYDKHHPFSYIYILDVVERTWKQGLFTPIPGLRNTACAVSRDHGKGTAMTTGQRTRLLSMAW